MKRKVSDLPSHIWTFGALAPTDNRELFDAQLKAAHSYYNALVQIERERVAAYRAARTAVSPDYAALEARHAEADEQVEDSLQRIKNEHARARKRLDMPAEQAELKRLKAVRAELSAQLKAAREALKTSAELKEQSAIVNEEAYAKVRAARSDTSAHWGTYLLVEKAIESARANAEDPDGPGFKPWRREGRVGVQLHHERVEDVLAGRSNWLRIRVLDKKPPTSECATRGGFGAQSKRQQSRAFAEAQIRVGSVGRSPVWVTVPVLLTRAIPPHAKLTWAWVRVTQVGARMRYELQLTLESETFRDQERGEGVCAVDLGWRKMPGGGLRVAYLCDDRGRECEVQLPKKLVEGLELCDELRRVQRLHFDAARAAWLAWLTQRTEIPAWLQEIAKLLPLWRSSRKLAMAAGRWVSESGAREEVDRLWKLWSRERLDQRRDLFASSSEISTWAASRTSAEPCLVYVDFWRRKNKHLWDWEQQQRSRCLAWRKAVYRNLAAELDHRVISRGEHPLLLPGGMGDYRTVVFEDMDIRKLARKASPEERALHDHLLRIRSMAAPGALRETVKSTMGKTRVQREVTRFSTMECHVCRVVTEWPEQERQALILTCSSGHEWDQDANAGQVLLRRWFERFGSDRNPAGSRDGENIEENEAP